MKIAIYTSVCTDDPNKVNGGLIPYKHNKEGIDYIAFTNTPKLKSDFWDVRETPLWRNSRWQSVTHRILVNEILSEYDVTIYMDNNIMLQGDPYMLVQKYLANHDMALFRHSERNCVYDQLDFALTRQPLRDNPESIMRQKQYLDHKGYPAQNGLFFTGVIFRKNNVITRSFNTKWFNETTIHTTEDEVSLRYIAHEMRDQLKIHGIDETYQTDPRHLHYLSQSNDFTKLINKVKYIGD